MGRIKSVSIVALGHSADAYAHAVMEAKGKPTSKLWAINRAPMYLKDVDLCIAMDDHTWMERKENYPGVRAALLALDIPVMTAKDYGLKNYVEYPLKKVLKKIPHFDGRYLDNSINFALALAITMKIKEIRLYGCDFTFRDSVDCIVDHRDESPPWRAYYKKEHSQVQLEPGGQWIYLLMGVAEERGLEIKVPTSSTLVGAHRETFFYGYLEQPEI